MAFHVRRQIRDQVVTMLTGLATTGSRVYASRVYPFAASDLPCLAVMALTESSEPDSLTRPRGLTRTLTLAIEARARASADLDDTLDAIAKEVEEALGADPTLAGLAKDSYLAATEIELSAEADAPHGLMRLELAVEYRTAENAPDVAL